MAAFRIHKVKCSGYISGRIILHALRRKRTNSKIILVTQFIKVPQRSKLSRTQKKSEYQEPRVVIHQSSISHERQNEVVRFLDTKHENHYKIYNLCSERSYDPSVFHNRVERILIDDHNVPRLSQLLYFTHNVREWLDRDPKNVVAVHCKGGKGRTGTAVCAWLIASGQFEEAQHSLDYFGHRRTDYSVGTAYQGVQTPSQSRFVGYLEQVFTQLNGRLPPSVSYRIKSIKIDGISSVGDGNGCDLSFEIIINGTTVFKMELVKSRDGQVKLLKDLGKLVVILYEAESPTLTGDVKIKFYSTNPSVPVEYDNCAFFFWFHTSFIENNRLFLHRGDLDNPHKSKTWKTYKENFAVDITFVRL